MGLEPKENAWGMEHGEKGKGHKACICGERLSLFDKRREKKQKVPIFHFIITHF